MLDYFYSPPEYVRGNEIIIEGEEFAHLVHVMRKKEGDRICIVDGKGTAYDVAIESINRKIAACRIELRHEHHHESMLDVTLAVGILKNPSKFDFLVEKVTELGVKRIIPLRTARTIPHHAKVNRWQKLALAAMKQCGRSFLPDVTELMSFDELLSKAKSNLKFVAHEQRVERKESTASRFPGVHLNNPVTIMIGPEGGFTDDEIEQCMQCDVQPVYLGERRLRTETAAIVMSALILLGSKA